MSGTSFEVSGTPGTSTCKVKLNGEEIQNSVQGIVITGEGPGMFDVEIRVAVFDDLHFDTQWANVHIPDSTHELLLKLGWTPPKETP